jgi:hypothetical protein
MPEIKFGIHEVFNPEKGDFTQDQKNQEHRYIFWRLYRKCGIWPFMDGN